MRKSFRYYILLTQLLMFYLGLTVIFSNQPVFAKSPKSTKEPVQIPGDANADGKVDETDYQIWLTNYNLITTSVTYGNFNPDNKVNSLDFAIWRKFFLLTYASPTPQPTATPTTMPSPSPSPISCLSQAGPLIVKSGIQTIRYDTRSSPLELNTKIDARTAAWIADWPVQDSFNYPVLLAGGPNVCFAGGEIRGNYPEIIGSTPHDTWNYMHGTAAIEIHIPNFILERTLIHNYGDGVNTKPGGGFFTIKNVYFSHLRDDCIENDYLFSGLIDDSLFDGCYEGFSTRPECTNCDGKNETMTIQNSLVRLEPMYGIYKNRGTSPGHDGFFKWDTSSADLSTRLVLKNNIFRADQQANNVGLGLPKGKVTACENNIFVWLGPPGTTPQPIENQDPVTTLINGQPCFTITNDISVWDNAVSSWKQRHGF